MTHDMYIPRGQTRDRGDKNGIGYTACVWRMEQKPDIGGLTKLGVPYYMSTSPTPPDKGGCRDVNRHIFSVVYQLLHDSTCQNWTRLGPGDPGHTTLHYTAQVLVGYPVPRHLGATLP